jgi:hypothetical protein
VPTAAPPPWRVHLRLAGYLRTLASLEASAPDDTLTLARRVSEDLSPEEVAAAEQVAQRRALFTDEASPR